MALERRKSPGEAWETVEASDSDTLGTFKVVVELDTAEVIGLGTPLEIVPAPGAGRAIALLSPIASSYTFGTKRFFGAEIKAYISDAWNKEAIHLTQDSDRVRLAGWESWNDDQPADVENMPLYLQTADLLDIDGGPILTHQLGAGGSGYAVNDTGFLQDTVGGDPTNYTVLTVDGGGAVLTYSLTPQVDEGAYHPGEVQTQTDAPQPGVGTGFTVDVLTNDPGDGSLKIDLWYRIIEI